MMAQVITTVTAGPARVPATVRTWRDQARTAWSDATPLTRAAVQMGALIGVVVIAYSYSLITLFQLADLNTPLAYVSLVPVISLILAAVYRRPRKPEPAIHDRQTDYIIGIPLMAGALCVNLFLPSKLSAMFWVWRIDLLTLPFFVAGAVAVIFGVRVLWRQKVAVAFLLLAWPYPYTSVLLGVLNAFTSATLFGLTKILHVVHVAVPVGDSTNAVFTVVHAGHPFNLSVISACSGVSSVVGFLLVGTAFLFIIRGPIIRKLAWLAGGMLLLWVLNLGRLVLVFWAGKQFGEHFAIDVLHPFIGLVAFIFGVTLMILCTRPLGLKIGPEIMGAGAGEHAAQVSSSGGGRPGRRHSLPVPHVYLAVTLVLVFAIFVGASNVGLQSYNLVADVSGSPKIISFVDDPVTPVGWTSRYETTFSWAAPLFGENSIWNRYELSPSIGGDLQARTEIVADVIDTPDLESFAAFGVEQCYQFHGYGLTNVSQVNLAGGIVGQTLSYNSQQFGSWTIVYWILPVKRGSSTVYERVVLYVQNHHGVVVEAAHRGSAGTSQASADGSENSAQTTVLQNQDFLVAYAREMIRDQASRSASLFAQQSSA
jgi:exosortase/archaeosortase family protein